MTQTIDPFSRPSRYTSVDEPTERSPWFPSFLEKLAVAIVTAHPEHPNETEGERHIRVRNAVCALSGRPLPTGAPPRYDLPETFNAFLSVDQKGIVAMARNDMPRRLSSRIADDIDHRDAREDFERGFSPTRLAKRAEVRDRYKSVSAEAIRKRIAQESYRNYLFDVAFGRVEKEEADMKADLDLIAGILHRWNIQAKVDPIALALASFWNEAEVDDYLGLDEQT